MLVKIEVAEDNDGLMSYMGVIDDVELKDLVDGTLAKAFVTLDKVYWRFNQKAKSEFEEDKEVMVKYGEGIKRNLAGRIYIRADRIRLVSPIKALTLDDGSLAEIAC